MAELVLSTIGHAVGASLPGVFGALGGVLGRAGGALVGGAIDRRVFGARVHRDGPRLTDLHLQASIEGASIPAIYGSVRIAGQVIWAARFKEHAQTSEVGGGGKGGGRITNTSYVYSLSFAVGLCEGEIARIARVWANGELLDMSQISWRVHTGREDQAPDALIEAIEGEAQAPAYRGLAYVVFEDLPLERFGNAIPQLSFEVMRAPPARESAVRFEQRVKGVCLIPGAGEFVYATTPVRRAIGAGRELAENVHLEVGRANVLASLDQLAADFPNCDSVLIVCAWFGDDLRCGACTIRPGVEVAEKETSPLTWRAGAVTRAGARLISQHGGGPAFGGTPDDASVLQLIAELKARGYAVGLYPFLMMDVPADNTLPDPYGGERQDAYPWRGRINLHPAPGQGGSPDKTAAAATQIGAFFGAATPAHFGIGAGVPSYAGPDEWSYRRFILHYAKLAEIAGGVDAFIIGSEMRGVTTARDGAASFPAVAALQALAGDVRGMLGAGATITYAADWSEYFGCQPQDGSGDVLFHLDPLWADPNIDVIGIDWYPPLTDWRDGAQHLDAGLALGAHDEAYLAARIEAGEAYDWHYASPADRAAQLRAPISDGAYDEPWIFRAKDIRNYWARQHYNRIGGVRAEAPTPWVAESKPVWLIELGCPAVDKGANAPNLFVDSKSAESALPPYSSGMRDDLIQRRTLDAYLRTWFGEGADNPASSIDARPMIERAFLWCWDARPYPAFPARADVWSDGAAWRLGHWLNGRAGLSDLGDVVADLCARAGIEGADTGALLGAIGGYVAEAPSTPRALIEPLMAAFDFTASERDGRIVFSHRGAEAAPVVALGAFTAASSATRYAKRGDGAELPIEGRVRFIDPTRDYLIGAVSARRIDRAEGGVESMDAPLCLQLDAAEEIAQALLSDHRASFETAEIELGPAALAFEAGDYLRLAGGDDVFEIVRVIDAEARALELRRARPALAAQLGLPAPGAVAPPREPPAPVLAVLDLPLAPGAENDPRPLAAVFAAPWLGAHDVFAGATLNEATRRGVAAQPAVMGELLWALWPGPVDRWDDGAVVRIKLYGGVLSSATGAAVLAGANAFAIQNGSEWEIVQARNCTLVGDGEYELSGLLRGRLGSGRFMGAPHPVGARIVKLDRSLARLDIAAHEWGEVLTFAAPPHRALAQSTRASVINAALPNAALRPWAPAHVRAHRAAGGDVLVSWVRCARIGGDAWGPGEPALGAAAEAYLVEVLDEAEVRRAAIVSASAWTYETGAQTADFGAPPTSLWLRIAQIDDYGRPGLNTELTITL